MEIQQRIEDILKEIENEYKNKKLNKKSIRLLSMNYIQDLINNCNVKVINDLSIYKEILNNTDYEIYEKILLDNFKKEVCFMLETTLTATYKKRFKNNSKLLLEKINNVSKSYKNIFKTSEMTYEKIIEVLDLNTIDYLCSIDSDVKFIQEIFKYNNKLDLFKTFIQLKTVYFIISDSNIKNDIRNILNDKVKTAKESLINEITLQLYKTNLSNKDIKNITNTLNLTSLAFIFIKNNIADIKIDISKYVNENEIIFDESKSIDEVFNIEEIKKQIFEQRYLKVLKNFDLNINLN